MVKHNPFYLAVVQKVTLAAARGVGQERHHRALFVAALVAEARPPARGSVGVLEVLRRQRARVS